MSNLMLLSGVLDWFHNIWLNLWQLIDNVVYSFINWVYRIFILIADVNIFQGSQIEAITRRLYIIVGIAMLFIFAYNLVLLIINPEGNQLGNMGKVVKNAIVSIILVTFLPLIFSYMTTIQTHVLDSNVIGKVILGVDGDDLSQSANANAGVNTAIDMFTAFYHPVNQSPKSCEEDGNPGICAEYVKAINDAKQNGSISTFILNSDLRDGVREDTMEYNYIISTIAGILALWIFVSFAIDIGVRVAKLAFYEIIAPIPVMMRILPGDKMFDKWFNGIKNTYLSLFLRLAIIYFAMYAISLVPDVLDGMWADMSNDNPVLVLLANVVIILGILKFAQEAPKLLSDIFGGSGDKISLGVRKKLSESKPVMAAIGASGAALGGFASNAYNAWKDANGSGGRKAFSAIRSGLGGFVSGGVRGAVKGSQTNTFKGVGAAIQESKYKVDEKRNKHVTTRNRNIENYGNEDLRNIPIIGGVADVIQRNVRGAGHDISTGAKETVESVEKWLSGGGASEFRAKGISNIKEKSGRITSGYQDGTEQGLNEMIEKIRSGGFAAFKGQHFEARHNADGSIDADSVEEVVKALKIAVKAENRKKIADNYNEAKNKLVLQPQVENLLKAIEDSKFAIGDQSNRALAEAIKDAATKAKDAHGVEYTELKNSLESFITRTLDGGYEMKWDKLETFLSSDYLSSDLSRETLFEVATAVDKGMDAANRINNEQKISEKK